MWPRTIRVNMTGTKNSKSVRKYLRREKSRIRKEFSGKEEQEEKIGKLYEKTFPQKTKGEAKEKNKEKK
jgi:hypothetical protein